MNITLFWKDKMIFKGFEYLLGKVAENYFESSGCFYLNYFFCF